MNPRYIGATDELSLCIHFRSQQQKNTFFNQGESTFRLLVHFNLGEIEAGYDRSHAVIISQYTTRISLTKERRLAGDISNKYHFRCADSGSELDDEAFTFLGPISSIARIIATNIESTQRS